MRADFKGSLVLFSPVAACVGIFFAMTTLPSYLEQRAIVMLLVNYVISNLTLSLMMNTMAGKRFTPMQQPVIGLLLVPLVAYHGFGASSELEQWLCRALTVLAFLYFYGRIAILAIQWCDYADTPFFSV